MKTFNKKTHKGKTQQSTSSEISYEINEDNEVLVSAKELHGCLNIKTPFKNWFLKIMDFEFEEDVDFEKIYENNNIVDYLMSIDMTKEVAIIQKSKKGQEIRRYLINLQKNKITKTKSDTKQNTSFRQTAKIFGVREKLLVNWLLLNDFCYRDEDEKVKPFEKYKDLFDIRNFSTDYGYSGTQTLVNPEGREIFYNMLIDQRVIGVSV